MMRIVSEALAERGHHVEVHTTTAVRENALQAFNRPWASFEVINGVRVFRHPIRGIRLPRFVIRGVDLLSIYPHGPYAPGMLRHLATGDYDVIISATFPFTYNYFAWLFSRLRGKGLVFYPLTHFDDRYHFDRSSLYAMMRGAEAVVANTAFEARKYLRRGVRRENLFVSGCCVDPRKYVQVESKIKEKHRASRLILFLGRGDKGKGADVVVKAAAELASRRPDWLFVFAGEGTKGIAGAARVLVLGPVEEREKLSLLSACDILVLPSTMESFGMVFLEAWMYEKPVIGALTGVTSEVIRHGKDGLLIPAGDHLALARAIEQVVATPGRGRGMGAAGRRKALARFTPEVVAGVFEKAVNHAAGKRRAR